MRFVLDEDCDVGLVRIFAKAHHQCWSIRDAGLTRAGDDEVAVYADDKGAVLISHDQELFDRRRERDFGHHIYLKCLEYDARKVVRVHLDEIVRLLDGTQTRILKVTTSSVTVVPPRRL